MALSYAKLKRRRDTDVVLEFFELARVAEFHRRTEYDAIVKIQAQVRRFIQRKRWTAALQRVIHIQRLIRGCLGRKFVRFVMEAQKRARIEALLRKNATSIQRMSVAMFSMCLLTFFQRWRGYRSRKKVFDYQKRRLFVQTIEQKMDATRRQLSIYARNQREAAEEAMKRKEMEKRRTFADSHHHLLGTGLALEADLRESRALRVWTRRTVGHNPRGIKLKPSAKDVDDSLRRDKLAQGPFLHAITMSTEALAQRARVTSHLMQSATAEQKCNALRAIHSALAKDRELILAANKVDLENARREVDAGTMSSSLFKRLDLGAGGDKYAALLQGVLDVDKLDDPTVELGKVTLATKLDDNLDLFRVSCPVGVLLIIFEARPEVVVQISCLAIKSGNAVILKGGKEAAASNAALYQSLRGALSSLKSNEGIPVNAVQLVETRDEIDALLRLDQYIDLVIPRGSKQLVQHVQGNTRFARIPVLGHADGLCSIFLDASADIAKAVPVVVDAKTSYPAACNSMETLIVHSAVLSSVLPAVAKDLIDKGVTLKADTRSLSALSAFAGTGKVVPSTEADYSTEFLDFTLAIKTVDSLEGAVDHINEHGSHHTDCIVTEEKAHVDFFLKRVDAAGVYWNASTRFADGFRYGFGAEIGVSTNKTHARGPVGLEGLVIYKYKLYGQGHATTSYGEGKKAFLHTSIPVTEEVLSKLK
ncbi:hypothetical protein HK101_010837 [Irineochytrium annulatum]|nr:hypothetical protein HK101_010837 [Irineochytrium annulatum]